MIIIPITHCQSCAELIGIFNTVSTICRDCATAQALIDQDRADCLANEGLYPEHQQFTALEKRKIEQIVEDTARNDINAAYSLIHRYTTQLVAKEEYTKAVFLRGLRMRLDQRTAP
jgi:hypothetical protein